MSEEKPLREMFQEDFGVDLPVSGQGGGPDSPFTITVENAQQAVDVQAGVLRCLGRGRQVAWRYVSQEVLGSAPVTTRIVIKALQLTEKEVVTTIQRYYFVWDGPAANDPVRILPLPSGYRDPRSGLLLPYEIGWLHLGNVIDNEPGSPGLGVTVAYGGLWMKATLYLYDGGQPVDAHDQERIEAEFNRTINDALRVMQGATVSMSGTMPDESGQAQWWLAFCDLPDKAVSAVILGAANRHFVKGRVTWQADDKKLYEMGHECVAAVMRAMATDEPL